MPADNIYLTRAHLTLASIGRLALDAQNSPRDPHIVLKETIAHLKTELDSLQTAASLARRYETFQHKRGAALRCPTGGDSGKLRRAIAAAGIPFPDRDRIYSEKRANDTRRIKLWHATTIVSATDQQRKALQVALRKEFGERLISAELINLRTRHHSNYMPAVSYAVHVKRA